MPAHSELLTVLRSVSAVFLVGIAVKLMDDLLDGEESWSGLTPVGQAVYAMATLALGLALAPQVGFALFAGAYALGMLTEAGQRRPTALPIWLETAAAVGLALLLSGPTLALQALLSLAALQLLDDLIDYRDDSCLPGRSWAHRLGRVEAALLCLLTLILATIPGFSLPLAALATYGTIAAVTRQLRKGAARCSS